MNAKKIRKIAKHRLKQNYVKNVLVAFVVTFILTGGISYVSKNVLDIDISNESAIKVLTFSRERSNSDNFNEALGLLIKNQEQQQEVFNKLNNGFNTTFINIVTSKQSMIFNMLRGVAEGITGELSTAVIVTVTILLYIIFRYGFLAAFEVGQARYYLEQRKYLGTQPSRISHPYKSHKGIHVSLILLARSIFLWLWSLTIIGYFIKFYEYSMIPYVLAENPKIGFKDAFKLSKELTRGKKFELFKLSLTIILWHFLGLVTFNLSNIFFVNPYEYCMFAEAYIELKKDCLARLPERKSTAKRKKGEPKPPLYSKASLLKLLNDGALDPAGIHKEAYQFRDKQNKLVKRGAAKKYSITTYILFFFTFAFVGWAYEVIIFLINEGRFVNRGTMYGPWLPIYGTGGVAILFLLQKFRKKPSLLFLSSFLLCGIIEFAGGWFLDTFEHTRYWDYTGFAFNINGYIYLESLLVFGLGGCGFTYIAAPILDDLYAKIGKKLRYIICAILIVAYATDFACCMIYGYNTGEGISGEDTSNTNTTLNIKSSTTLSTHKKARAFLDNISKTY